MSLGNASVCLAPTTQGWPGVASALSTCRRFLPSQPRSRIRGDLNASEEANVVGRGAEISLRPGAWRVASMRLGRPHAMRYCDVPLNLPGEPRDQDVGTLRVAPRFRDLPAFNSTQPPLEVSDED